MSETSDTADVRSTGISEAQTDSDEPATGPEPGLEPTAAAQPPAPAGTTVMLLGSGELSRELTLAFQRLGAEVIAVDRYADAPAHGVADRSRVIKMNDAEALTAVIEKEHPRYVVAEANLIAADALIAVAERGAVEVFPTPRSTRLSLDREGLRRLAADELGLPTAPFWFAGSAEELTAVTEHAGFPLVVKPMAATPGEGESVLLRPEDVEPAWQRAVAAGRIAANRVMVETVVEIDYEVTLLTVRTTGPTGPTVLLLRADRPPPARRRRARVMAAPAVVTDGAGCRQVDRRADRQLAGWARRVRRRAAGARRRGLLRRRAAATRRQRAGDAAVAAAFGVRTARPRDPRAVGGHHHGLAGRRRGQLRRGRCRPTAAAPTWPRCWARRSPLPRAMSGCSAGPTKATRGAARCGARHGPRRDDRQGPGPPGFGGLAKLW